MNQNVKQRPTGEKRKRRLPLYSLVLIGCLAAVGLFAGLSARYVHLHSDTDAALAQHFYFTSDVLGTPVAGGGVSSDNTYTLAMLWPVRARSPARSPLRTARRLSPLRAWLPAPIP